MAQPPENDNANGEPLDDEEYIEIEMPLIEDYAEYLKHINDPEYLNSLPKHKVIIRKSDDEDIDGAQF